MKKRTLKLFHKITLYFTSFLFFISSSAIAANVTFAIESTTSAWYNTPLPPLPNAYAALTQLTWDVVGFNQIQQSNWNHGGGWLAFVVYTDGNINFNQQYLNSNYNGVLATYFGTYYIGGSRMDLYYGPFSAGYTFRATLPTYIVPGGRLSTMFVN